jgi:hypothetical protein
MARSVPLSALIVATGLSVCCVKPEVQPAPLDTLTTGTLGFLKAGVTTREEILLKFGAPSAHFEGDRILTYQFQCNPEGQWVLRSPHQALASPFLSWARGSCNLVLVFEADGRLLRHNLVVADQ